MAARVHQDRAVLRLKGSVVSTNFYAVSPSFPEEGLHIGKHSGGWRFLWRAHPDLGLTTGFAWYTHLRRPFVTIVALGVREYSLGEFWSVASRELNGQGLPLQAQIGFAHDGDGFAFCYDEFC